MSSSRKRTKREIRFHFEGWSFSSVSKAKLHDVVLIKFGQGWLRKALQANPRSLFVSHFLNLSFKSLGRFLVFLKRVSSKDNKKEGESGGRPKWEIAWRRDRRI